ncbi:MAG: ABC transporter ATP-binding protein [Psychrobium sp.]|nr:ABC transporter ATP-binding protein [Psychrobium sp.]
MSLIKLEAIGKSYGDTQALQCIDVNIETNEYVSIFGPSGCGKSTLLSILGLVEQSCQGRYLLLDHDVTTLSADQLAILRRRHLGFIFQNFNLIDHLNNIDNIALPLIFDGMPHQQAQHQAQEALNSLNLVQHGTKYPWQLSGGQQQRIAIARALVNNPDILLVDEPTGNLDSRAGDQVMEILDELHRQGSTIVLVTHDEKYASRALRQIVLKDGQVSSACYA